MFIQQIWQHQCQAAVAAHDRGLAEHHAGFSPGTDPLCAVGNPVVHASIKLRACGGAISRLQRDAIDLTIEFGIIESTVPRVSGDTMVIRSHWWYSKADVAE